MGSNPSGATISSSACRSSLVAAGITITGMTANTLPRYRVIVHPSPRNQWTWTQVSRNGSALAVAPGEFDNKANAKRAARRQVDALNWGHVAWQPIGEIPTLPPDAAVLVVDESYRR